MKRIFITASLCALVTVSLSAQDASEKGPEFKNRKAKDMKTVEIVSVEQSTEKGPKRKNANTQDLIDAKKAKKVRKVARKGKGPKAKNTRPGN